jgi:hypothetical protein
VIRPSAAAASSRRKAVRAGQSRVTLAWARRVGIGLLALLAVLGPGRGPAADAGQRHAGQKQTVPGETPVRFFGTEGKGYKFVYVLDRSGSMGGSGAKALRAAKTELLSSIETIERTRQFQIVFYNEEPWQFNPSGQRGRLGFATDRNKMLARRFIESIAADGGTEHEAALKMALRMRPDVIFWLTDADEPRLSPAQVRELARAASGVVINAVEFGPGPRRDKNSFLRQLARATGGQYRYVDVGSLKTEARK